MTLLTQISSQAVQRLVQFRARPDAPLRAAIQEAARAENIGAGVIVSGLGALKKAVFRNLKHFPEQFPVTPDDRLYLEVSKPMELVALKGWIAPREDGEPEIHAHFAASLVENGSVVTMGGHLTDETICGIKVAVAILVVAPDGVRAALDPDTQTLDLFLK
ncbi:MAG: DNA-binding protein [Desulfobacterales bacterium]|jgi:predicted DNA-binding protein with PD1-like motif